MYQSPSTLAFSASALMALVSASPLQKQTRDTPQFGPVTWVNPAGGGNIQIFFSNQTLNFGTVQPADIINANVSQTCVDQGVCEEGSVDLGQQPVVGELIAGAQAMNTQDMSYVALGQYPVWIHNAFINTLTDVLRSQTKSNSTTVYDMDRCSGQIDCVPEQYQVTQYYAPASIGVIQTNTGNAVPGSMQVQFTTIQKSNDGFCEDITTIGGGVAGMFTGIAGGVFTLAGLGCTID